MTVERKQIGDTETYREHKITVHYMGPDLTDSESALLNAFNRRS